SGSRSSALEGMCFNFFFGLKYTICDIAIEGSDRMSDISAGSLVISRLNIPGKDSLSSLTKTCDQTFYKGNITPNRILYLTQLRTIYGGQLKACILYIGYILYRRSSPCYQRDRRCVQDRKSTRLNSSHVKISYAVFC